MVEGHVFGGHWRERRQAVTGVVGDVGARRTAAAGVHRRRTQRHVLVDFSATVETFAELGHERGALPVNVDRVVQCHLVVLISHRRVVFMQNEAFPRQLGQLKAVRQTICSNIAQLVQS